MAAKYSDCYFCGGAVEERLQGREIWWQGKLHLIQDVPVGVCRQCGEKTILPENAKVIDQMLSGDLPPESFVKVPTYRFPEKEQVA